MLEVESETLQLTRRGILGSGCVRWAAAVGDGLGRGIFPGSFTVGYMSVHGTPTILITERIQYIHVEEHCNSYIRELYTLDEVRIDMTTALFYPIE